MNEVYIVMKVEIWSDFVSPLCYIANRKFELALEKFENQRYVKVEYRSFILHRDDVVSVNTCKELLMKTCNVSFCQIDDWIEQLTSQANELNLPFDIDGYVQTNTLDAHRLVKFAEKQGKAREIIHMLFHHFFTLADKSKDNIDDKHILVDIAQQCGLNDDAVHRLLSIKKYSRAVELDEDDASEIGIENVPFFIFNEKYALVGNQPIEVFLEALQDSWSEDEQRLLKKQVHEASDTCYCVGDDCDM